MKTIKVSMDNIDKKPKAPILSYCRKLIEEGEDPNSRLEVYREHEDPDVIVPNIGEGVKWTVLENNTSGPVFVKYTPRPDLEGLSKGVRRSH